MTTAFIDEIQIDELIVNEYMFELWENNWESLIESDQDDWILIEN
jgi:kynurenine formamidase